MSYKSERARLLPLVLLLLCAAAVPAVAQSSDRDRPTPLTSNELSGHLSDVGGEYFYSFVAGPGEVTLTVDVKSTDGTKAMMFELLNRDGSDKLLCCELAQADQTGQTGRTVKSVRLSRRQTVLLRLEPQNGGHGSYRVRLTGAVDLAGASGAQGAESNARGIGLSSAQPGGNQIDLPSNGVLVIELNDGTVHRFNLSHVRQVRVNP